jgi:hypothetical protein
LLHGIQFSHSNGLVFEGLEVHGEGIWDTALVSSGISFTDRDTGVINFGGKTSFSQELFNFLHFGKEWSLRHEWQDGALDGGDQRWEIEVGSLGILLSGLEAVLKDAIDNSTNTK